MHMSPERASTSVASYTLCFYRTKANVSTGNTLLMTCIAAAALTSALPCQQKPSSLGAVLGEPAVGFDVGSGSRATSSLCFPLASRKIGANPTVRSVNEIAIVIHTHRPTGRMK